jgi:putative DNA primase/helicase
MGMVREMAEKLKAANADLDEAYNKVEDGLNAEYLGDLDSTEPQHESAPAAEDTRPIRLCVITSKKRLSKAFELKPDGTLQKVPGGAMYSGKGTNRALANLERLAALIADLKPDQALTFGRHLAGRSPVEITTGAELKRRQGGGRIARTREYFAYPDTPGILLLDYDAPNEGTPLSPAEYWETLRSAVPALDGCEHLIISSASSYIYRKSDGAELIGARGLHCFVTVERASDIPMIGGAIDGRLWLAGHGRREQTKDGKEVKRSLVDTSVWQPERLSFDAGAACGEGLEQRRPAPVYVPDKMLSLAAVALTPEEQRAVDRAKGIPTKKPRDQGAPKREPANLTEVEAALSCIPADVGYEDWLKIGMALRSFGDDGFALWHDWSEQGEKYPGRPEMEKKWASFDPDGGVSIGTLFHIAGQYGFQRGSVLFADALVVPEGADALFIVPDEDVSRRWNEAGYPCIGIPDPLGWSKGADEPSDAFSAIVSGVLQKHPSLRIVAALYPEDGTPRHWSKGDDGATVKVPMAGKWVSDSTTTTEGAYRLAEAVRKIEGVNVITTARFLPLDSDLDAVFNKRLEDALKPARSAATLLADPIFCGLKLDPDALGQKGAPSADFAFCDALNSALVGVADDLLYEWTGSHWSLLPQARLKKGVYKLIAGFFAASGDSRKIHSAPQTAVSAAGLYEIPKTNQGAEMGGAIIPCADVTLDIAPDGTVTPREPSKDDGLRYCVNARWVDKGKPSPEFDKFISDTLPDPAVRRLVQQYVGYTLISDTRFQVAQWWFGNGANGKGFLAQVVSALHRKVAAADIEDLGGFGAENLIDASLITVDETPKRIDEQRLKSAISGDDLNINRKYQVPVTVRLRAKWLLRGNDKPALSDQTDGIWRRLQIIEFTEKFEGNRRDDMLADRIVENELPGVLRWAVDGLVMLLKAGGFKDIPESVLAAKREMQLETDNVLGWWVAKDVQVCDAPRTSKDSAYRNYSVWCKDSGMMPLGAPRFWARVRSIVERDYGELRESRPRVTFNDPITGTTNNVRVLKVNLDLEGNDRDDGGANNVVPLPVTPLRASTPEKQAFVNVMTAGFAVLDDGDDDYSDVPF